MNIKQLEDWYEKNHRKLEFRESNDPYKIWVSEIMLQQTQVETVLPFFKSFMIKYPTVFDLANETEENLRKQVEGLGYYRRFKNMQKAAKMIVETNSGQFPNTYHDIIKLPGIGRYTAGAIMSICYNEPISAVDGNVIRVLSRFYNIHLDMKVEKNKKVIEDLNQKLIIHSTPKVYTQAMMELGATLCRPKQPKCEMCPIAKDCKSFQLNNQNELPFISKSKDKKIYNYIVLLIENQGKIYLRKRTESLLEGMYEYPQFESESIHYVLSSLEERGLYLEVIDKKGDFKHHFTHQTWNMEVYRTKVIRGLINDWIYLDQQVIKDVPMAIAHRKIK